MVKSKTAIVQNLFNKLISKNKSKVMD